MKTAFFTDPHIGLVRAANTTSKSRELLREHLYDHTMATIAKIKDENPGIAIVCLGDLFDTYSNEERYVKQGADIMRQCDILLSGNHDMSNREDVIGSLQLLGSLGIERNTQASSALDNNLLINTEYDGSVHYARCIENRTLYTCISHTMTQALFEEALDTGIEFLAVNPEYASWNKLLLLHCNVGEPHDHDIRPDQTALWLLPDMQKKLLQSYDYILVGHEHVPRSFHQGRLLVLGNVYPIGFGEMADRFYYIFDSETKEITSHRIVDIEKEFLTLTVDAISGSDGKLEVTHRMVQIEGRIKPQESAQVSRSIATFWKMNPYLFAVRPLIEIDNGTKVKVEKDGESSFLPRTLKSTVAESVKTTPFQAHFDEIVKELDSGAGTDD